MRVVIYKQADHKDLEFLINDTKLSPDEAIVDVEIQPVIDFNYIGGSALNEMKRTVFLATVYIEEESI